MKFVVLTTHGQYIIEAEDFDDAIDKVYDDHVGYDNLMGIIKIKDESVN